MNVCSCSSPACRIHGCQANKAAPSWTWPVPQLYPVYYPDQTRPVIPIDADGVRRIVQEEIEKALGRDPK